MRPFKKIGSILLATLILSVLCACTDKNKEATLPTRMHSSVQLSPEETKRYKEIINKYMIHNKPLTRKVHDEFWAILNKQFPNINNKKEPMLFNEQSDYEHEKLFWLDAKASLAQNRHVDERYKSKYHDNGSLAKCILFIIESIGEDIAKRKNGEAAEDNLLKLGIDIDGCKKNAETNEVEKLDAILEGKLVQLEDKTIRENVREKVNAYIEGRKINVKIKSVKVTTKFIDKKLAEIEAILNRGKALFTNPENSFLAALK